MLFILTKNVFWALYDCATFFCQILLNVYNSETVAPIEDLCTILEMVEPWLHSILYLSISNYASLMVKNILEFRQKFMNKNFIKCFIVMLF